MSGTSYAQVARCVPRLADHRKDMASLSQIVLSSRMTLASYIFLLGPPSSHSVPTASRLPCCSVTAGNREGSSTKVFRISTRVLTVTVGTRSVFKHA